MNSFKTYFLISIFGCCICIPLLNSYFNFIPDTNSYENRLKSPKPQLNPKLLDPFPSQYEKYFDDNFTLRNRFIKLYNQFKISGLNKSPYPDKIIVGNNGWLYNSNGEMDCYSGIKGFTQKELEQLKTELEYRNNYLQKRGCKFYFVICPAKSSIHSENVPLRYKASNQNTWGQQLIKYLNANSKVKCINLFIPLKQNKTPTPLFYRLDNHWNYLGGYYAYNEMIDYISKDYKPLKKLPLSNFTITKQLKKDGNLMQVLGNIEIADDTVYTLTSKTKPLARLSNNVGYDMPKRFAYTWEFEKTMQTPDTTAPKLLIISDSNGEHFFAIMAESFKRTVKIFDAWEYKLNEKIVNSEKPDVFILLIHETTIKHILDRCSSPELQYLKNSKQSQTKD